MKLFFTLFLSTVAYFLSAQTTTEKLDTFLTAACRAHEFNGVVLVARNDSILLSKGYGWRNFENKTPHDVNSIFQVGSVTKTFTATLILFLQEHGKLDINEYVSNYFPGYKYADKINIKNLLTHTSGIFDYTSDKLYDPRKSFSQQDFWAIINKKPLEFEPDSKYEYSNANYFLLGLLIEKITGKSYEQNIKEIIFQKAGMKHSGFDFANLSSRYKSVGYDIHNDGKHVRSIIADSSGTYAAGSLYTTIGDLYLWYKALKENLIISESTFKQAVTAYKGPYGLGWQIDSPYRHIQWKHDGGIMGFAASYRNLPDENACFIVLRNESLYPSVASIGVLSILYGIPNHYIPRLAIAVDTAELKEYIGKYKLEGPQNYEISISVKDGQLHSTATGGLEDDFYKEKKDTYFLKSYDCQFVFTRNNKGEVTGLTGYLGGQSYNYKKVD
jgi:CubicO group peptidase (beta-lactamase class C family)